MFWVDNGMILFPDIKLIDGVVIWRKNYSVAGMAVGKCAQWELTCAHFGGNFWEEKKTLFLLIMSLEKGSTLAK